MILRNLILRIVYPDRYSSDAYIKFLKSKGCSIGDNVKFFNPIKTIVDVTRPHLVSIGDYCKVAGGVIILSHDYSRSVLRIKYNEIIGEAGITRIGKNVFIGMNAIILMGVHIGSNVIIGAGSVVTYDIPDDTVAAGNPAKVIMSLDEYYKKRKEKTIEEAKEYAREIYRKTKRTPSIHDMDGFYPLYLKRDIKEFKKNKLTINFSGDDYDDSMNSFLNSNPVYSSYEEFLNDCNLPQRGQ